jgi:hypothetical protein
MEFVEDHERHTVECGVPLEASGENAVGDDLDPGRPRDPAFVTRRETDRLADPLADQGRHPSGGGAGRHPTRLEEEHATTGHPRLSQQAEGNDRRLACARFGLEDRGADSGQGVAELVDDPFDRKAGRRGLGEGGHRPGYGSYVVTRAGYRAAVGDDDLTDGPGSRPIRRPG